MDMMDTLGEGNSVALKCDAIDERLSEDGANWYLIRMGQAEGGDPSIVAITFVREDGDDDSDEPIVCPVYGSRAAAFGVADIMQDQCDYAIVSGDFNTENKVTRAKEDDVLDLLDAIYLAVISTARPDYQDQAA